MPSAVACGGGSAVTSAVSPEGGGRAKVPCTCSGNSRRPSPQNDEACSIEWGDAGAGANDPAKGPHACAQTRAGLVSSAAVPTIAANTTHLPFTMVPPPQLDYANGA